MSPPVFYAAAGLALLLLAITVVPRLLLKRAQDRLATRLLEAEASGGGFRLLTRADLVTGERRRLPGVLGLTADAVVFEGLFGEREVLATSAIVKIITGRRMSSGRTLVRREVLRLGRSGGGELEVVLTPASAGAWRSHLGLWAIEERKASADTVTPGRK